jgi:hypothetical protein
MMLAMVPRPPHLDDLGLAPWYLALEEDQGTYLGTDRRETVISDRIVSRSRGDGASLTCA